MVFSDLSSHYGHSARGAEPLLVLGALLLCVDPSTEQRPGLNGEGVLLIHAAVK